MKRFTFFVLVLTLLATTLAWGQWFATAKQTGNWSSASTWEKYNGSTWDEASAAPGASDNVFIENYTYASMVITIDTNASCNRLLLLGSTSGTGGATLQFASSGSITLTVNDTLRQTGGNGTNIQGSRSN
jgi:hypothetical protein